MWGWLGRWGQLFVDQGRWEERKGQGWEGRNGGRYSPCPLGTVPVHGGLFHGCGAAPSSPRLDQDRLHHMAPSGAAPAQHHHQPRGGAVVVDISVAGLGGGVSGSASSSSSSTGGHHYHHYHHQHNHRRAGAALSANSISAASSGGTPSMDVSRHRRTSSTSSPALPVPPPAQVPSHFPGIGSIIELKSAIFTTFGHFVIAVLLSRMLLRVLHQIFSYGGLGDRVIVGNAYICCSAANLGIGSTVLSGH